MIYGLLKRMIVKGNYQKDDMQNKLNVFFAVNQITQEQYLELTELINSKESEAEEKPVKEK